MSRRKWLERGALVVALAISGMSWRQAQVAAGQVEHLQHQVDVLKEVQDRLNQGASDAPIPSSEIFRAQRPTNTPRDHALDALSGDDPVMGARERPVARARRPAEPQARSASQPAQMSRAMLRQARKAGESPGAMVLDTLYEAADQLALDEGWDAHTYEDVTRVFDRTMMEMNGLFEQAKAGEITVREARQEAFQLRDRSLNNLQGLIGQEGIVALQEVIVEEVEAKQGLR